MKKLILVLLIIPLISTEVHAEQYDKKLINKLKNVENNLSVIIDNY